MTFRFYKMQGCGNDFLFLDSLKGETPHFSPSRIVYLCDRNFGLGADGLVVFEKSRVAHAKWKFYNSDGREAEMCGNAARCAIRFLSEKHFPEEDSITLETRAGIIQGSKLANGLVEISLFSKANLKFDYQEKLLKRHDDTIRVFTINTGVPHTVTEVNDIHSYPIIDVGKFIRHHSLFQPQGTNVTFFQRLGGPKIRSTTFERGVERETLACGTGAAAASIVYSELYLQRFPIEVTVPGGVLVIDLNPTSELLLLRGPAEYVFDLELDHLPKNFGKIRRFSEQGAQ